MIGIILIYIAILGLQGTFSVTISEPPYGNLTVDCGTLENATNSVPTVQLSNESRAKLKAAGSSPEFVVALEKLKNSCRIGGQLRLYGYITVGIIGLAAVIVGLVGFGANKAPAQPSGPAG